MAGEFRCRPDDGSGRIIAHRGASLVAPENTLAAFREAIRQGASWIEYDVSLTGDGVPVVFHDEALGRCTSGSGLLRETTLEALVALDAGGWFGPAFRGERVPSLARLLAFQRETGLFANLEIKHHGAGPSPEETAAAVCRAARAFPDVLARTLVTSFSVACLRAIRRRWPAQRLGLLFDAPPPEWRELAAELGTREIHVDYQGLDGRFLGEARDFRVRVFTVDDLAEAKNIWISGICGVITNAPGAWIALEGRGARGDGVPAGAGRADGGVDQERAGDHGKRRE